RVCTPLDAVGGGVHGLGEDAVGEVLPPSSGGGREDIEHVFSLDPLLIPTEGGRLRLPIEGHGLDREDGVAVRQPLDLPPGPLVVLDENEGDHDGGHGHDRGGRHQHLAAAADAVAPLHHFSYVSGSDGGCLCVQMDAQAVSKVHHSFPLWKCASVSARRPKPRCSRDLTVPGLIWRASAVSSVDQSRRMRHTTTERSRMSRAASASAIWRSEERRVGKERRPAWWPE